MGSIRNAVYYCCVSRGNRVLYSYHCGEHEIDKLVSMCLEMAPPYHKWYFQTTAGKTYGFLMEEGNVYFAIADESVGNLGILELLKHLRDEFKKVARKGSTKSMSNSNSLCLQEKLVPVIHGLIASLEQVAGTSNEWPASITSPHGTLVLPPCADVDGHVEVGTSTKAALLRSTKHEKRKLKDHAVGLRHVELEVQPLSTDRGVKVDSGIMDSNRRGERLSPISLHKDLSSTRLRSSAQNPRKQWCRLVRIILAIDVVICLVLFAIWLAICGGVKCLN